MAKNQVNSLGKAVSLGIPTVDRKDKLGKKYRDLDDLFRFSLLNKSSIDLDVSGMKKANFDVELYAFKVPLDQIPKKDRTKLDFRKLKGKLNQYLELRSVSANGGTADENIETELEAGDYLIRVTRRKGDSKYQLSLDSTPVTSPPNNGGGTGGEKEGNSLTKAYTTTLPTPTASTSTSRKVAGAVSNADTQDYYRFTLAQAGTFDFKASGFQGKADLQLLNSSGGTLQTYTLDSTSQQNFSRAFSAGTYYFRVYQEAAGDATNYSLTATKQVVKPPVTAGNSFETAFSATIPTTKSIAGNFSATDKLDYYKFSANGGDYLFNLAGNLKIEFFDKNKNSIKTTYKSGDTKFIQPLSEGLYYFKVSQRTAATTASYSVTASAQTDGVGNTAAESFNSPELSTELTLIKRNYVVDGGKKSFVDYYKFNVPEYSKFQAELRNMFGNLGVRLVNVNNLDDNLSQASVFNRPNKTTEVVIPGPLDAGDYVLQVFAPAGEGSTYDLYMALNPTNGEPNISADVNSDPGGSSNAKNLVEVGNAAFFVATDNNNQTALYRTTGTIDKLKRIKEFDSVESFTYATNDAFYFVASAGSSGNELWQCTVDGTVKQITSFTSPSVSFENGIGQMAAVGNYLYFLSNANDGEGAKLRRADLSSSTPSVDSSFANNLLAEEVSELTVVNNQHLFFVGSESDSDRELWRIQNAGDASIDLEKINLNINEGSSPSNLTVVGPDTLYVTADRTVNNTPATRIVKLSNIFAAIDSNLNDTNGLQATNIDLQTNLLSGSTKLFLFQGSDTTTSDDILYFTANVTGAGRELMKLENPLAATGSSTVSLVHDINPDGGSSPSNFVEYSDKLYFVADDGNGAKIWYTNGTGATAIDQGLRNPNDLTTNVSYSLPGTKQLVVVGNTLYLTASTADSANNTGLELWQVKDTTLSLVKDINSIEDPGNPGTTADSSPEQLTSIGGSLFFIAEDGESGREVWSVTPTSST